MALNEKASRKYDVSTQKDDMSLGAFSRLKDPVFRSKFLRWIWLPCAMFSLGIVVAQGGPTILDLEIITDQDEEMGSIIFTAISGGYVLGSFAAGAIHGKISNNIVLALACLFAGGINIATPYCPDFIVMLVVRGIVGFFLGVIDCSVNAEHMHIWRNEGQALLQLTHFAYALGGVVSPAFSAPFLAEKDKENKTTAQYTSFTTMEQYLGGSTPSELYLNNISQQYVNSTSPEQFINTTQGPYFNHTEAHNSTIPKTTDVYYAFWISGIIMAVTSIPFFVLIFLAEKPEKTSDKLQAEESHGRKLPVSLHLFLISVLCLYYVTYCCIENTFSSFLETFLVDRYDNVSKEKAAYITTYYWAAFAVGRFISVFTSKLLIAVRLLYLQYTLVIISFVGFYVSAYYAHIEGITAFSCLIGVGLSSVYPAGFSWTEAEIMTVTGRISGVILVGSAAGSMINPYIMGYLMEHKSNFWFCYFLVGSVAATFSLFLFMLIFNRLYVNKRYGTVDESRPQHQIIVPSKSAESGL